MSKYINQLTDTEIEEFFYNNGYALTKDLKDPEGFPIDAIERGDEDIFVRAQKLQRDETEIAIENYLIQKAPHIAALSAIASMRSGYGRNIDLIHFSDYFMSKFCITETDKEESEVLCSSYLKFMNQKFPTYRDDLIEYCDSLQEEETKEQSSAPKDQAPEQTM